MPLPALAELPQLTELSFAWRRLVDIKPVLIAVNNTNMVCCCAIATGSVGGLIADHSFNCDCPGAELVLASF